MDAHKKPIKKFRDGYKPINKHGYILLAIFLIGIGLMLTANTQIVHAQTFTTATGISYSYVNYSWASSGYYNLTLPNAYLHFIGGVSSSADTSPYWNNLVNYLISPPQVISDTSSSILGYYNSTSGSLTNMGLDQILNVSDNVPNFATPVYTNTHQYGANLYLFGINTTLKKVNLSESNTTSAVTYAFKTIAPNETVFIFTSLEAYDNGGHTISYNGTSTMTCSNQFITNNVDQYFIACNVKNASTHTITITYTINTYTIVVRTFYATAYIPPQPKPHDILFTSYLNYQCRTPTGTYPIQRPFKPLVNSSFSISTSGNYTTHLSQSLSLYGNFNAEWGLTPNSNGILAVNGQYQPFGTHLYPNLQFLAPSYTITTTNTTFKDLFTPFRVFYWTSKSVTSNNYTFVNASTFNSQWDSIFLLSKDGINYTIPATNYFLSGFYPNISGYWTGEYRIPNLNNTVSSTAQLHTTLVFAIPLSRFPSTIADLSLKNVTLTLYSYTNDSRLAYTSLNGQTIAVNGFHAINITNATHIYNALTYNGQAYIDLELNTTINSLYNTSKLSTGYTYANTGILPINVSLSLISANATYTLSTLLSNVSSVQFNTTNDSIVMSGNTPQLNYETATLSWLNSTYIAGIVPSVFNWYYNRTLPTNTYFTVKVDNTLSSGNSVITYDKLNYSGSISSIKIPLPSDSVIPLIVYYQNSTTGIWSKMTTVKYASPIYSPCVANNTYIILCTSTTCNVSATGSTATSNFNKTTVSSTSPIKTVQTPLGDTWFAISSLGSFSFILTTQFWYLIVFLTTITLLSLYLSKKAIMIPLAMVTAFFMALGYLTGILNPLFSFAFAILLGYFAFATFREVFLTSGHKHK